MRSLRTPALVLALVCAVTGASSCGGSKQAARPPTPVPVKLIPPSLPGDPEFPQLSLTESKEGEERIARAGKRSLVDDGRVWEIRRGTVLIGVLQISTLKPKVDVRQSKTRADLADLIMPGALQTIQVAGISVRSTKTPDKTLYLWFGQGLFEVLQLRGEGFSPPAVLKSVIEFQKPTGQLRLPADKRGKESK